LPPIRLDDRARIADQDFRSCVHNPCFARTGRPKEQIVANGPSSLPTFCAIAPVSSSTSRFEPMILEIGTISVSDGIFEMKCFE
jgi:hypothetical protein